MTDKVEQLARKLARAAWGLESITLGEVEASMICDAIRNTDTDEYMSLYLALFYALPHARKEHARACGAEDVFND